MMSLLFECAQAQEDSAQSSLAARSTPQKDTAISTSKHKKTTEKKDTVLNVRKNQKPIATTLVPIVEKLEAVPIRPDSLQVLDSTCRMDSLSKVKKRLDSLSRLTIKEKGFYANWFDNPFYPYRSPDTFLLEKERKDEKNNAMFYFLMLMLLLIALMKVIFPKEFNQIISIVFNANVKSSAEVHTNNFAVLILNFVMVCSGSMMLYLLFRLSLEPYLGFMEFITSTILLLSLVYLIKFIFLRFIAWALNERAAIGAYIQGLFSGLRLFTVSSIPLLFFMTYGGGILKEADKYFVYLTASMFLVFRLFLGFSSLRVALKLNLFHFIVFVIAFEVMPLFLIFRSGFDFLIQKHHLFSPLQHTMGN